MTWWEQNAHKKDDFIRSVGGTNAKSRQHLYKYIERGKFASILECGCGFAVDKPELEKRGLKYSAIEITPYFYKECCNNQIDIKLCSIEDIDHKNKSFDVVYCRHVFEHLEYYKIALKEMFRVAKKQVIVIFFVPPQEKDEIVFIKKILYHNKYSKSALENFISLELKSKFKWESIGHDEEAMLIIYKNRITLI